MKELKNQCCHNQSITSARMPMIIYSNYTKPKLWIRIESLSILLYYFDPYGTHVENVFIEFAVYTGATFTVPTKWSKEHPLISSIVT